jgi:hypothetical protein
MVISYSNQASHAPRMEASFADATSVRSLAA